MKMKGPYMKNSRFSLEVLAALCKMYADIFNVFIETIEMKHTASEEELKICFYSRKYFVTLLEAYNKASLYAMDMGYPCNTILGGLNLLSKYGGKFYIPSTIDTSIDYKSFCGLVKRLFFDILEVVTDLYEKEFDHRTIVRDYQVILKIECNNIINIMSAELDKEEK